MFKTSPLQDPRPRQLARMAFGVVLIGGVARLISTAQTPHVAGSTLGSVIGWAWVIASAAALATYVFVRIMPWRPVRRSESQLQTSWMVPIAGIALLLPITIHLLCRLLVDGRVGDWSEWVSLSLMFTGFAHVVFAVLAATRAAQLASGKPAISCGAIYGWCVLAANVPFPILPAFYVAATGLPILPMLMLMKPLIERERRTITGFPTAIAQPR
jgi:hypothetical protein